MKKLLNKLLCAVLGHKIKARAWKGSVYHKEYGPCNVFECPRCKEKYLNMMV